MAYGGRYGRIAEILGRHGLGFIIGAAGLQRWLPVHHGLLGHEARDQPYTNPEHLRLALEQLGPTFIKLGQILSTRPDLLPDPYRRELANLQDSAPPVSSAVIAELIEHELGDRASNLFAVFDDTPLASASLGQAHAGTLHDGSDVVVKIRRPRVVEQVEDDLEVLRNLVAHASRHWEAAADYDLEGIADEFAITLRAELDYLHEARNAERFAANFAADPTIRIPRIHWDTTTSRVITLDRIRGVKVNDLAGLDAAGLDRRAVADNAARAAAKMIFEDGFFHADPHPGNLFVQSDGRIGLIDFGMVGEIDERVREQLAALIVGLARQNARHVASSIAEMTSATRRINVSALAADLAPIIDGYGGRPLGDIAVGALIQAMQSVARRHHLALPRELALLAKTLVMAEGLARELDPELQFAKVIEPYARRLVAGRYKPNALTRRLRQAGVDLADVIADLPPQLSRLREVLDAGGPEVHLSAVELEPFITRVEAAGRRVAAAVLAAAVIRTIGDVLTASRGRPAGRHPRGLRANPR